MFIIFIQWAIQRSCENSAMKKLSWNLGLWVWTEPGRNCGASSSDWLKSMRWPGKGGWLFWWVTSRWRSKSSWNFLWNIILSILEATLLQMYVLLFCGKKFHLERELCNKVRIDKLKDYIKVKHKVMILVGILTELNMTKGHR